MMTASRPPKHVIFINVEDNSSTNKEYFITAVNAVRQRGRIPLVVLNSLNPANSISNAIDSECWEGAQWLPRSSFGWFRDTWYVIRSIYMSLWTFAGLMEVNSPVIVIDANCAAIPILHFCGYKVMTLEYFSTLLTPTMTEAIYRPIREPNLIRTFCLSYAAGILVPCQRASRALATKRSLKQKIAIAYPPSLCEREEDFYVLKHRRRQHFNELAIDNISFVAYVLMTPQSNLDILINAFDNLLIHMDKSWKSRVFFHIITDVNLDVRSEKNYMKYIQNVINLRRHSSQFNLFINISEHKKCTLLSSCASVINASEGDNFNCGILESFYFGRPVISIDSGFASEIINANENGFFVKKEQDHFTDLMSKQLGVWETLNASISINAQQKYDHLYSSKAFAHILDEALFRIVNNETLAGIQPRLEDANINDAAFSEIDTQVQNETPAAEFERVLSLYFDNITNTVRAEQVNVDIVDMAENENAIEEPSDMIKPEVIQKSVVTEETVCIEKHHATKESLTLEVSESRDKHDGINKSFNVKVIKKPEIITTPADDNENRTENNQTEVTDITKGRKEDAKPDEKKYDGKTHIPIKGIGAITKFGFIKKVEPIKKPCDTKKSIDIEKRITGVKKSPDTPKLEDIKKTPKLDDVKVTPKFEDTKRSTKLEDSKRSPRIIKKIGSIKKPGDIKKSGEIKKVEVSAKPAIKKSENIKEPNQIDMSEGVKKPDQIDMSESVKELDQIDMPEEVKELDQIDMSEGVKKPDQIDMPEEVKELDQIDMPEEVKELDQIDMPEEVKELDQIDMPEEVKELDQIDMPEEVKELDQIDMPEAVNEPDQIDMSEGDKEPDQIDISEGVKEPDQIDMSEDIKQPDQIEMSEDTKEPDQMEMSEGVEDPEQIETSEDTKEEYGTEEVSKSGDDTKNETEDPKSLTEGKATEAKPVPTTSKTGKPGKSRKVNFIELYTKGTNKYLQLRELSLREKAKAQNANQLPYRRRYRRHADSGSINSLSVASNVSRITSHSVSPDRQKRSHSCDSQHNAKPENQSKMKIPKYYRYNTICKYKYQEKPK